MNATPVLESDWLAVELWAVFEPEVEVERRSNAEGRSVLSFTERWVEFNLSYVKFSKTLHIVLIYYD